MNKVPVDTPAELKEAYPFTCDNCGHEQMAAPSIFMTGFGMNSGGGHCMKCDTNLHLEIAPDNEKMISKVYSVWAEEEKERMRLESES